MTTPNAGARHIVVIPGGAHSLQSSIDQSTTSPSVIRSSDAAVEGQFIPSECRVNTDIPLTYSSSEISASPPNLTRHDEAEPPLVIGASHELPPVVRVASSTFSEPDTSGAGVARPNRLSLASGASNDIGSGTSNFVQSSTDVIISPAKTSTGTGLSSSITAKSEPAGASSGVTTSRSLLLAKKLGDGIKKTMFMGNVEQCKFTSPEDRESRRHFREAHRSPEFLGARVGGSQSSHGSKALSEVCQGAPQGPELDSESASENTRVTLTEIPRGSPDDKVQPHDRVQPLDGVQPLDEVQPVAGWESIDVPVVTVTNPAMIRFACKLCDFNPVEDKTEVRCHLRSVHRPLIASKDRIVQEVSTEPAGDLNRENEATDFSSGIEDTGSAEPRSLSLEDVSDVRSVDQELPEDVQQQQAHDDAPTTHNHPQSKPTKLLAVCKLCRFSSENKREVSCHVRAVHRRSMSAIAGSVNGNVAKMEGSNRDVQDVQANLMVRLVCNAFASFDSEDEGRDIRHLATMKGAPRSDAELRDDNFSITNLPKKSKDRSRVPAVNMVRLVCTAFAFNSEESSSLPAESRSRFEFTRGLKQEERKVGTTEREVKRPPNAESETLTKQTAVAFNCKLCSFSSESKAEVRAHLKSNHPEAKHDPTACVQAGYQEVPNNTKTGYNTGDNISNTVSVVAPVEAEESRGAPTNQDQDAVQDRIHPNTSAKIRKADSKTGIHLEKESPVVHKGDEDGPVPQQKYKCKLCDFSSLERIAVKHHLLNSHPDAARRIMGVAAPGKSGAESCVDSSSIVSNEGGYVSDTASNAESCAFNTGGKSEGYSSNSEVNQGSNRSVSTADDSRHSPSAKSTLHSDSLNIRSNSASSSCSSSSGNSVTDSVVNTESSPNSRSKSNPGHHGSIPASKSPSRSHSNSKNSTESHNDSFSSARSSSDSSCTPASSNEVSAKQGIRGINQQSFPPIGDAQSDQKESTLKCNYQCNQCDFGSDRIGDVYKHAKRVHSGPVQNSGAEINVGSSSYNALSDGAKRVPAADNSAQKAGDTSDTQFNGTKCNDQASSGKISSGAKSRCRICDFSSLSNEEVRRHIKEVHQDRFHRDNPSRVEIQQGNLYQNNLPEAKQEPGTDYDNPSRIKLQQGNQAQNILPQVKQEPGDPHTVHPNPPFYRYRCKACNLFSSLDKGDVRRHVEKVHFVKNVKKDKNDNVDLADVTENTPLFNFACNPIKSEPVVFDDDDDENDNDNEEEEEYTCMICNFASPDVDAVRDHVGRAHPEDVAAAEEEEEDDDEDGEEEEEEKEDEAFGEARCQKIPERTTSNHRSKENVQNVQNRRGIDADWTNQPISDNRTRCAFSARDGNKKTLDRRIDRRRTSTATATTTVKTECVTEDSTVKKAKHVYKCTLCSFAGPNPNSVKHHQLSAHSNNGNGFKTSLARARNKRKAGKSNSSAGSGTAANTVKRCRSCSFSTTSLNQMRVHSLAEHPKRSKADSNSARAE